MIDKHIPNGYYQYKRPLWKSPFNVEVITVDGCKYIKFYSNSNPVSLKNCPSDATLSPRLDLDSPLYINLFKSFNY